MMTCRWRPHHRAAVAPGDSRPHHPLITSNQGPPTMSYLLSLRRCTAAFAPLLALISALPADAHNPHPLGRQAIFWDTDPHILRTVATNFDFHGGGDFITWRPHGQVQDRDGRSCLVGPHFLFDVDDDFAFDIDETVTLELLFDRNVSRGFNLSYDHVINPRALSRTFPSDSQRRWHTEVIKLERARFANRKYEKTDFSIAAPNSKFPPGSYQHGHEVALCGIKISRENNQRKGTPTGRLRLKVTNERGDPDAARVGLYDAEGSAPLADPSAVTVMRFEERIRELPLRFTPRAWPSTGRFVFYIDGEYQAEVPAGTYTLAVSKGPEYRVSRHEVVITGGETTTVETVLARWIDMPARGWFSGDDHVHIGRPDPVNNDMILTYTRAEDVHLSNLLQMANVTTWHFPQYAFGQRGHHVDHAYALVPGQESPRTSHRGHTIGLNAKRFHWPGDDYFLYDHTANAIHADGGLWGYAHVALDAFNVAWGLALDVPLGFVDFFEMLQMDSLNTGYMYDFLNMGFRMLPSAGSDYPYIHVAGTERVYVQVNDAFTVQGWFDAWRNNRAFVSNGPMIEFTVNGDAGANELEVKAGTGLLVKATARVNPDYDNLDRLELVAHGNVVRTVSSQDGAEVLELEHELTADGPLWFALRSFGKAHGKAHTGPVYVYVDGNRKFHDRETVSLLAEKYKKLLVGLKGSTPTLDEEWERFNVEHDVLRKWHDDKPGLDERIERAIGIYQLLIDESRGAIKRL